jgi:hypothetical protein
MALSIALMGIFTLVSFLRLSRLDHTEEDDDDEDDGVEPSGIL